MNWVTTNILIKLPTDIKSFGWYGPDYDAKSISINGNVNNIYQDEDGIRRETVRKEWNNEMAYSIRAFIQIENGENEIIPRLEKAIKHLATFCPKIKETF